MELIVKTPEYAKITFNFEDLKTEMNEALKKYQSLVYTDEAIKDAKSDRATLNKFKDAIETKRKEIKKQCMEPYEVFAEQVKTLTALIDEPLNAIDAQVKAFEERKRTDRLKVLQKFYDYHWKGYDFYRSVLPFEKAILLNKKMLNASENDVSAEGYLHDVLERLKADLNSIVALELGSNEAAAIEFYKTCYNINAVIEKSKEFKALSESKKRQEEKIIVKQSPIYNPAEDAADSPVIQVDFRVWGTKEQLVNLQAFLKDNSLKYGTVK